MRVWLIWSKRQAQAGVADLLPIVIGVPIILLLIAFLYNLLSGPYLQRDMRNALAEITSRASSEAAKDESLNVRPIDLGEPAGNLINPVGGSLVNNAASAGPGFLNRAIEESLVTEACKLSSGYLSGIVVSDRAFEFGIVKLFSPSPSAQNSSLEMKMEFSLVCPNNTLSQGELDSGGFSVAKAAQKLRDGFHDIPGSGSGLWLLNKFNKDPLTLPTYLPSYWMVGVATGKSSALVTNFFGGAKYISDYHIHPFSVPAGIERVAQANNANG